MYYTIKELREKLPEILLGLGIDPRFKENPAFTSAVAQIDGHIGDMNLLDAEKEIAFVKDGKIDFSCRNGSRKYSLSISSSSPKTFSCICTREDEPYVSTENGQYVTIKDVTEEVATINDKGCISLTTNSAMIDNMDCIGFKCNIGNWVDKKDYTIDGVMTQREYRSFPRYNFTKSVNDISVNEALYDSRNAFGGGYLFDKYDVVSVATRDKFDTAYVYYYNKTKNIRYKSVCQLNNEHGLKEMGVPVEGSFQPEVYIPALSQETIEAMIQKERDPKVAEGLRKFAVGRETYSYNSAQDPSFVYEGFEQSHSISK